MSGIAVRCPGNQCPGSLTKAAVRYSDCPI